MVGECLLSGGEPHGVSGDRESAAAAAAAAAGVVVCLAQ